MRFSLLALVCVLSLLGILFSFFIVYERPIESRILGSWRFDSGGYSELLSFRSDQRFVRVIRCGKGRRSFAFQGKYEVTDQGTLEFRFIQAGLESESYPLTKSQIEHATCFCSVAVNKLGELLLVNLRDDTDTQYRRCELECGVPSRSYRKALSDEKDFPGLNTER